MARLRDIPLLAPPPWSLPAPDIASALAPWAEELLRCDPLLVALNDPQRATRSPLVLSALAKLAGPARPPRLQIIVACGTHRFGPAEREAFRRGLPQRLLTGADPLLWHDCLSGALVPVGPAGQWRAHPALLEGHAPLLAIGSVEPHYFAGLTGAHKTCTIGLASRGDTERNHAAALSPACRPFALQGNPIHDGVVEMLRALQHHRPVLAVNLLQVGRSVHAVAAGDPIASLRELSAPVRLAYGHSLDAPADALVLEVAGPLGRSFYQADKAIKNSEDAVRDGGVIVLKAPCPDGIGQDHFVRLLREAGTHEESLAVVARQGYRLGDHKAVRLRRLTDASARGVRVFAVSKGLSDGDCRVLGFEKAPTVLAALARGGIVLGRDRVFRVADAANRVVLPPGG